MGVEDSVMQILHRFSPRPTFGEAKRIIGLREVQNEALWTADTIRNEAVQNNLRLQELGHRSPLNHRGFLVGGLGIGLYPDRQSPGLYRWFAFAAWNTRPYPKDHPDDVGKTCAEKRIGSRFLRKRCSCMLCLAVVGELNEGGDGRSGKHGPGPTIDPCEVCRDDMRGGFYELYQHDPVILTAKPNLQVQSKPRTLAQLMAHHNEVWWEPHHKVVGIIRGG